MYRIFAVVFALLVCAILRAEEALPAPLVLQLASSDESQRMEAARLLADTGAESAVKVLDALAAGQLYSRRSDSLVVIGRRKGSGYKLLDPVSGESLGLAGRREVSRIAITGAQRNVIRSMIVDMQLNASDVAARRAALDAMMAKPSTIPIDTVLARLAVEEDQGARKRLQILQWLSTLETGSIAQRTDAVRLMAASSHPSVRARLREISDDPIMASILKKEASNSLRKIDRREKNNTRLQTVFFGLSLGSVLVLAAIGLAITFGVMGVINMAHGELIMLGAYTTWAVQTLLPNAIGLALLLAIPLAFMVSALVGILIERTVIRHLYQRPAETLLATFGVSLILQQTVRSLFGPLNRTVVAPSWMSGSVEVIEGLALTYNRLFIILFCLLVFAALLSLIRFSRFGLELRAVAQNRRVARTLGVRSGKIDALTFGLGSGIAGIAGVALSQLTNVGPNLGQAYIVDSFLVVVVGGVGNLWGTLVAGLSIGIGSKLLEPTTGAVLAKIILLIAIILFIQKKPRGLFPQRGRVTDA